MYFDTHVHLENEQFQDDREGVINRAIAAGIKLMVNVGHDKRANEDTVKLIEEFLFIYGAVGIHPHDAKDFEPSYLRELSEFAQKDKVIAIGEIGLDYYYDNSPRDVQKEVFRQQIRLARDLKLPIIIHDRDAHQDTLSIVKKERAQDVGGVFHCYSGSWELAKDILKLGFYISLAGPVTFQNAKKTHEVAREVPLERLLIETDCPYLAPVPYRGKRNEPAYVVKTAEVIAAIKGVAPEQVAEATFKNGKNVFAIPIVHD